MNDKKKVKSTIPRDEEYLLSADEAYSVARNADDIGEGIFNRLYNYIAKNIKETAKRGYYNSNIKVSTLHSTLDIDVEDIRKCLKDILIPILIVNGYSIDFNEFNLDIKWYE